MEKKSTAKMHERKGMKREMAHKATARRRESKGMKKVMGESGNHMNVGAHEGRVMGYK